MRLGTKLVFAASLALALLPVRAAFAANDKERVLRSLDAAAAKFHSTSAEFEFDNVITDPVPQKEIQKGTVYYERKGKAFQMAAHISETDGNKKNPLVYSYSDGVFQLYQKATNQVTTYSKASQFESYAMMGFGASGKDLEEKWDITYLGPETLDGVKTEKLELVAKDPAVRKNIAKLTIWVDPLRAVSLKQLVTISPTEYKVCVYFKIETNKSLPHNAFSLGTDKHTQHVSQ